VPVRRPGVRTADKSAEVAVPAYELFSSTDVLSEMALETSTTTRRSSTQCRCFVSAAALTLACWYQEMFSLSRRRTRQLGRRPSRSGSFPFPDLVYNLQAPKRVVLADAEGALQQACQLCRIAVDLICFDGQVCCVDYAA
jgi:hypothetical protein